MSELPNINMKRTLALIVAWFWDQSPSWFCCSQKKIWIYNNKFRGAVTAAVVYAIIPRVFELYYRCFVALLMRFCFRYRFIMLRSESENFGPSFFQLSYSDVCFARGSCWKKLFLFSALCERSFSFWNIAEHFREFCLVSI